MLNRDFEVLTVNGPLDLTTKNVYAGSPLTNSATGYKKAVKTDAFVGLSYNYYAPEQDDVNGGEWFADSGKVGVVKIGQVTIDKDVYEGKNPVYPYDSTKTYAVGEKLYVDATGLITNDSAAAETDGKNFVGTVVVPATATDSKMVIYVNAKN